ncbi:MAG TPA: hypothetical protein VF796_02280 [Humisphaera sp.]
MKSNGKAYRGVALVLCGSIVAGTAGVGCTGNAGADGALVGVGAGLGAFGIGKAAKMKTGQAAALGAGVGVAAGLVTYFVMDAKYKREATDREREEAARRARDIDQKKRQQLEQKNEPYYVPVSKDTSKNEVVVAEVNPQTHEPTGKAAVISESDLNKAYADNKTPKIDGHEMVGRPSI